MKLLRRLVLMGAVVAVAGVAGDRYEWSQKLETTASTVAVEIAARVQEGAVVVASKVPSSNPE